MTLPTVLAVSVGVSATAQDDEPPAVPARSGGDAEITVMTRNLYLGADVAVALDLLPDLSAAAQFMWEQVAATDFDTRVVELADGDGLWACSSPDQIATSEASSAILTDAGLVSAGPSGVVEDPAAPDHDSFTISLLGWPAIIVGGLVLVVVLVVWAAVAASRRTRGRRRQAERAR